MADPLVLSQGAFLTFTGDRFRVGHAQDPYHAHDVHPSALHLLAAFATAADPEAVLDRLRVGAPTRSAFAGLVRSLRDSGVLEPADGRVDDPRLTRLAGRELVRLTSHVADIERQHPEFAEAWRAAAPFTLGSPALGYALWNACRHVVAAALPGAVVECGVWRGGSMMIAAMALRSMAAAPPLYLYDTFDNWAAEVPADADGFIEASVSDEGPPGRASGPVDAAAPGTDPVDFALHAGVSVDDVVGRLTGLGYPADRVTAVVGKVQDTVPGHAPERIALLRLDTDYYDSTRHELAHLYPRLVPGGVLIVDDYGRLPGASRAVDEYFAHHEAPILLHRIDVQGCVGVKPG